ncbi:MAG: InlB B-repeat-containing protein [Kiritimatiellae bacterium]|nr:InlB B-repeat-containing protein [Kiritimatiellia bacterium]
MASWWIFIPVSQRKATFALSSTTISPIEDLTADTYDSGRFGGYVRSGQPSFNVGAGDGGSITAPDVAGYKFAGWYSYSGTKQGTAFIDDATVLLTTASALTFATASSAGILQVSGVDYHMIYAKWTPAEYLVVFDPQGGELGGNYFTRVTYQSTYGTLPTPTRAGYTFAGWYTAASGGTRVTASTTVTKTANHILYAHWSQNAVTITVSFNAAGGTVSPASKTATSGAAYGTLPTPTRSGYGFNGWYTEVTGGTNVTASTIAGSDDITLHAQWIVNGVSVTFNGNGGTPSEASKTYLQGFAYGSLPTATRAGYAFAGWWTAATGGTRVLPSSTAAAGTLYAQWTAQQSVTGLF